MRRLSALLAGYDQVAAHLRGHWRHWYAIVQVHGETRNEKPYYRKPSPAEISVQVGLVLTRGATAERTIPFSLQQTAGTLCCPRHPLTLAQLPVSSFAKGRSMSSRNGFIETHIYDYILANSLRDRDELKRLRQETRAMPMGGMQISPDQGQFMGLLVELIGAKRIVEVGTFTGYSSTAMALALPADGRLIACDVSDEFTRIAQRYWQEAGVADKIELRLGPAVATLDGMLAAGEAGCFDMAFIDADKENYDAYYERCLRLLRRGGLILIDNVLWGGRPANANEQDESTAAIRALNAKIRADERVTASLLSIGDGLTLARKR